MIGRIWFGFGVVKMVSSCIWKHHRNEVSFHNRTTRLKVERESQPGNLYTVSKIKIKLCIERRSPFEKHECHPETLASSILFAPHIVCSPSWLCRPRYIPFLMEQNPYACVPRVNAFGHGRAQKYSPLSEYTCINEQWSWGVSWNADQP